MVVLELVLYILYSIYQRNKYFHYKLDNNSVLRLDNNHELCCIELVLVEVLDVVEVVVLELVVAEVVVLY